jgi:hypothetical protein
MPERELLPAFAPAALPFSCGDECFDGFEAGAGVHEGKAARNRFDDPHNALPSTIRLMEVKNADEKLWTNWRRPNFP